MKSNCKIQFWFSKKVMFFFFWKCTLFYKQRYLLKSTYWCDYIKWVFFFLEMRGFFFLLLVSSLNSKLNYSKYQVHFYFIFYFYISLLWRTIGDIWSLRFLGFENKNLLTRIWTLSPPLLYYSIDRVKSFYFFVPCRLNMRTLKICVLKFFLKQIWLRN